MATLKMRHRIQFSVGEKTFLYQGAGFPPITVREVDYIQLRVEIFPGDFPPQIYFEDYQPDCSVLVVDGVTYWATEKHCYFAESFGHAHVRIEMPDGCEIITLDVLAKKTSAEQACRMLQYIASCDESLIKSCFSRTTHKMDSIRNSTVDPEMLLSTAEHFITQLQTFQPELLTHLRERLVPTRVPLWETDRVNLEIDPHDVIHNLDALTPSTGQGDVFLRGRNYSLSGIHVSKIAPTADVLENRILLGGLYSIRARVLELQSKLASFSFDDRELPPEFESLSRLMLRLTAGGMLQRSRSLITATDGFIKLFEQKLEVRHVGKIAPVMTPFVRSTRVYRTLFTQLNLWYELGIPTLEGLNFLMKLKSLSRIYELFVLFHLLEELLRQGWTIESASPHESMGTNVPSMVELHYEDEILTLEYEPCIRPFSNESRHRSLVDVTHSGIGEYQYWTPDFVLRHESFGAVRYLILDAKYSTRPKVRDFVLAALMKKYFLGMAVYDADLDLLSSAPILGVFAIYPLDHRNSSYLSHWGSNFLDSVPLRLPMIGGIGLMVDNHNLFSRCIESVLFIARKLSYLREIP